MKQQAKFKQTEIGMIPEDWEVKRLKEVTLQIFSGGTPNTRKEEYWNGNLLWLSSGETRQIFIRDTERKITKSGVDNSSTRLAKKEDVVVAGAGQGHTRGQPSFCLTDTYINQSVVALRANKEKLTPFFLFYNLLSRYDELRQLSDAHSSRGSLTTKLLADLFIKLPELEEQEVISKILSDLDFKIELNQQMNKTLEAIGQAIFKHWFVDFEFPNEKGKPYKLSGGEMVDSEKGKIPKGWKVGIYGDLVNLSTGKGVKRDEFIENGKFPVIGANGELGRVDNYLFNEKLILTGRVGTLGTVYLVRDKIWISDNVLISKLKIDENYYYSYFIIKSFDFQSLNRGSTQPLITQTDLKNQTVIIPDNKTLPLFHKICLKLFDKIYQNESQNAGLSQIRDSLLPKLMSGKIRVPVEVRI